MTVDFPGMETDKPIDVAYEPVDVDDGIIDTGVLHALPEDEDDTKGEEDEQEGEDLRA